MSTILKLGQNGRMIIPAELRRKLELNEGDELLVTVVGKRLVLETEAALLERLYDTVGEPADGELVSDSLLRERREEAEREAADV